MVSKAINLKISTPFKNEFKGEVSYIEVPVISGMLGILPGHIPILSALSSGVIKVKTTEGETVNIDVSEESGFIRLVGDNCKITLEAKSSIQQNKAASSS